MSNFAPFHYEQPRLENSLIALEPFDVRVYYYSQALPVKVDMIQIFDTPIATNFTAASDSHSTLCQNDQCQP
jgi:hypothetical protein